MAKSHLLVNRHNSVVSLDSLLNSIYWRKRRGASIHCGQLNELLFIQHSLPNKISSYIYTRDYDSPDLYRYLCMFFHSHKIHPCTCSYRIPGLLLHTALTSHVFVPLVHSFTSEETENISLALVLVDVRVMLA